MQNETIKLHVNNKLFTGWTSVKIRRSVEAISGKFDITLTNTLPKEAWELYAGLPCKASIGDDILINGFIDKLSGNVDSTTRGLTISGRDKTGDLVDCSVSNTPAEWKNLTLLSIVNYLIQPFGLKVSSEVNPSEKFTKFTCTTGEKVQEAISRACNLRSVIPMSTPKGDLKLTSIGRNSAFDYLVYGENVKSASFDVDFTDRFSSYTILGQSSGSGNPWKKGTNTQVKGTASDAEIERFRPFVKKAESSVSPKAAGTRAAWEANIRASKSENINVVVQGVRMSNSALWEPNMMVQVSIPPLNINSVLLISSVEYSQDSAGTITTISLKRRDAFTFEPPRAVSKKKKGIVWK